MTFSATQQEVIDRLRAEGATRLVRWSGGFWTTPGTPREHPNSVAPAWSVGVQTVRALETKGVLRRVGVSTEWHDPRELVPEEEWPSDA